MPQSHQLAKNVDPLTRDFVRAAVSEATGDLQNEISKLHKRIAELKSENHHLQSQVEARINDMENTLSITPSSRRQLQRLVEMLQE